MNNKPLVSIIVLTYNGEKFIEQQLDSIFEQSYSNIEVLVFDDASSDATQEILTKYSKAHKIRCFFHEKNVGINQNFSLALKECNGEYIATSDQDDIWKKNKLELLVESIEENIAIESKNECIDEKNNIISHKPITEKQFFLGYQKALTTHCMMFKKELINYLEIPKEFSSSSGLHYDAYVSFIASQFGTIKYIQESLVQYRRHSSQITASQEKNFFNFFKRVQTKDKQKIFRIQRLISMFLVFSKLEFLSHDVKTMMKELSEIYKNSLTCYTNEKLYQYLLEKSDIFFPNMNEQEYKKQAKRLARGVWYYRLKLYM